MECKLKSYGAFQILIIVLLLLLIYQSFYVLPVEINKKTQTLKMVACASSPIKVLDHAIAEAIDPKNEVEAYLSDGICLSSGQTINVRYFEDLYSGYSIVFETSHAQGYSEWVDITPDIFTAKKEIMLLGGAVVCEPDTKQCRIILSPYPLDI
jgi:hypothetical protein